MDQKNKVKEFFVLAETFHKKNNFAEAQKYYESIIQIEPNHIESIFRLGSLFAQTNNFDKAINFLNKVIEINPNHSKAYNNLGIVFNSLKKYQKAKFCYEKAIEINPKNEETYNNLGTVFFKLDEFENSIKFFHKAIEINPSRYEAAKNISILLKQVRLDVFTDNDRDRLKKLFFLLYKRNDIEHKDIFLNSKKILLTEDEYLQLRKAINSEGLLKNPIIKNLLQNDLFLLMIQKSLIADIFFEKILTKIRYEILLAFEENNSIILEKNINFILSLAHQCFLNEYCFLTKKREIDFVEKLKFSIENTTDVNELKIAILGCYVHLVNSKDISNKLLNYKSKNDLFKNLINMHIKEPLKENSLMDSIKSLKTISDPISEIVRKQYEQNPFPRWRYTYSKTPSNPLVIINNQISPNKINLNNQFNYPKILIAGCGTGKQIFIAQNYLNSKISAVDLSKKSLAYAKRKIQDSKIDNVEFLHGDILDLNNLDIKFDIIECIGVLHHMKEPLKGLDILLNLLEPYGYMKLGLYSDIARKNIKLARNLIKNKNYKNKFEDIVKFRQEIIEEKKNELLNKILNKVDFYSTSGVRDLLFNVQEHRFTLPEISKILSDFNLDFLGFSDLYLKKKYSKLYPDDKKNISLNNWHEFEMGNNDTFVGMYNFWVKKKL